MVKATRSGSLILLLYFQNKAPSHEGAYFSGKQSIKTTNSYLDSLS
jgi:hypothetical protein